MRNAAVPIAVLSAVLAAAAVPVTIPPAAAAEPPRAGLAGDWETVIQSPRRPWEFVTHFTRTRDGWVATMSFPSSVRISLTVRGNLCRLM